jgi:hypothetical protein
MGVLVNATPRRFVLGKETRYLLYRRPRGPQDRSGQVRKISPPPAFDPRTFQPIASGYTDYTIPAYIMQYEGWSESKNKQWIFAYSVPFYSWSPCKGSRMYHILSSVKVCLQHVILWREPLWNSFLHFHIDLAYVTTNMLLQRAEEMKVTWC